jgi:hypothetical protein
MLQLKNETTGHVALEISGGGALIGIDGASDSVHILAICGNPIIKSTKVYIRQQSGSHFGGKLHSVLLLWIAAGTLQ